MGGGESRICAGHGMPCPYEEETFAQGLNAAWPRRAINRRMKHFRGGQRILMQERCAMDQPGRRRHGSFVGPIILIVLGSLLLTWRLYPDLNPWPVLFRYWPLILILIGLGKIWDSYYFRQHPDQGVTPWITGTGIAWILLLVFFVFAAWHGRDRWDDRGWHGGWNDPWGWHGRTWGDLAHDTQAVELQGAKSVDMNLNIPAGELTVSGGSTHLMDADFRY